MKKKAETFDAVRQLASAELVDAAVEFAALPTGGRTARIRLGSPLENGWRVQLAADGKEFDDDGAVQTLARELDGTSSAPERPVRLERTAAGWRVASPDAQSFAEVSDKPFELRILDIAGRVAVRLTERTLLG